MVTSGRNVVQLLLVARHPTFFFLSSFFNLNQPQFTTRIITATKMEHNTPTSLPSATPNPAKYETVNFSVSTLDVLQIAIQS